MTIVDAGLLRVSLTDFLVPTLDADWRLAACAAPDENPEDWFPFPTEDFEHAAAVCAECPISAECERYGRTNRMSGVWGGVRLVGGRPA